MKKIGLLGAGVMGSAAGQRVLEAGHELVVFDPTPKAREWARKVGCQLAGSPAQAAAQVDLMLMFLPGPLQIRNCVLGDEGILSDPGKCKLVVDLATSDPDTTKQMAEACLAHGIGYLDAPVLGRPMSLGSWALPIGGRAEDLETARPILELFASRIYHIGESGSGHTIKLLNQMMFGAINAMTAEMMAVASAMGYDPAMVVETITGSQAGTVSNLFKELGERIVQDNYESPTFSVDLLIKDVCLGVEMARKHGTPPLLGQVVSYLNEIARRQGFGSLDTAVMWKSIKSNWEKYVE
jgi:3-hydroxyisobutyrate dehydrogenase-like beta-hydroxyacid dehydrogenase